jgi:hypothetical protein
LPPRTLERGQAILELHDDAPKKVTTQRAAIIETEVKGFHPELNA